MTASEEFLSFLLEKKIDAKAFFQYLGPEFRQMDLEFAQLGKKSFDQQKKFFLNNLRLMYPAPVSEEIPVETPKPVRPKPIIPRPPAPGTS
ncbi:MAG: hypothetical protein H6581_05910 [Bacteroidia bacterium]|nr:hypothetical protein [Bacteroidia bacterium]